MDSDRSIMLQEENDRLREQVSFLERALGLEFMPPLEWRLTPQEARLFGVLLARDLMTREAAMAALYRGYGNDEPSTKIIDVFVCKIRKKLKPFGIAIENRWGSGYYLTPEARTIARELLEAAHG